MGAQQGFPGTFTAFGGAILFVGCTLLAMNYKDQQDMAHVPIVGKSEHASEAVLDIGKPPVSPGYASAYINPDA